MKALILTTLAILILIGVGLFISSSSAAATEKPDYTIETTDGDFEIRSYPSMLLAEVTVDGDRRNANNQGFRKLAAFIFGDNVAQDKVAMTSPVVTKPASAKIAMTSPVVSAPTATGRWTVNFMMPSEYTRETLPVPTDPDIRIFESEPYRTVSIRFNGAYKTKNIAQHEAELMKYVKEKGLAVVGNPEYAGYDAPWVPNPMKRNEVHFRLAAN